MKALTFITIITVALIAIVGTSAAPTYEQRQLFARAEGRKLTVGESCEPTETDCPDEMDGFLVCASGKVVKMSCTPPMTCGFVLQHPSLPKMATCVLNGSGDDGKTPPPEGGNNGGAKGDDGKTPPKGNDDGKKPAKGGDAGSTGGNTGNTGGDAGKTGGGDGKQPVVRQRSKADTPLTLDPETTIGKAAIKCEQQYSDGLALGEIRKRNGLEAQCMQAEFDAQAVKEPDTCNDNDAACIGVNFCKCSSKQWQCTAPAPGTQCVALPLRNAPGVSLTLSTKEDQEARVKNALDGV